MLLGEGVLHMAAADSSDDERGSNAAAAPAAAAAGGGGAAHGSGVGGTAADSSDDERGSNAAAAPAAAADSSSSDDGIQPPASKKVKAAAKSKRVSDDSDGEGQSMAQQRKPQPLKRSALPGRMVLMPASTYPGDVCEEHDGRGWSSRITSVSRGVVRVKALEGSFASETFRIDEVMRWEPLLAKRQRRS